MAGPTRRALLRATATAGVAGLGTTAACAASSDGTFSRERYGDRLYWRYLPTSYDGSEVPLLVLLHGCSQDPAEFAAATRMNELAEREGFVAIYPDQTTEANASECWNWFDPDHQRRGAGEPALIAGTTRETMDELAIDSSQVYLAGFSAGAAMAPVMAVAYPDVYDAVGVHSGLEYDAANDSVAAVAAMQTGGPDPQRKGAQAYEDMGSRADVVRTAVFHGTDDATVAPVNGHQAAAQATQTVDLATDGDDDGTDATPETAETRESPGHTYCVREYEDENGRVVVSKYIVEGMGHAWAGGDADERYTDPDAPDASRIFWECFTG